MTARFSLQTSPGNPLLPEQTEDEGIVNTGRGSSVLPEPPLQIETRTLEDPYGSCIEVHCMGRQPSKGKTIERVRDKGLDCLPRNPASAVLSSEPVSKFSVVG